ncbi:hypothetical protein L9F63_002689, partial [Diploptera punctata]
VVTMHIEMAVSVAVIVAVVVVVLTSTTDGKAPTKSQNSSNDLIVTTAQGKLRGSILTSRKGKQIYSFRGVRFAQPPVGELRFKAPVPPESWTGIRNATDDGLSCPQPWANGSYPTSEDCLFLNVYTTALSKNGNNPNRPVVVFFHSGGWFYNSGGSFLHGPQYLLDKDIVLVVTNYRLAALGFLSTGDDVLIGNYGMKDQVATLRWVQQNIAVFGGNPKDVTIAGCSVGGASIWLHMISPMSRGLFNKGISMSMGVNTLWDVTKDPVTQAKKQAALLNCPNDTSVEIAECLRGKGDQEIASTYFDMLIWEYQPLLEYTPIIEKDYGQERFLTENPMKTFLEGNFVKIPWMTGVTKDELDPWAYYVVVNKTLSEQFYDRFDVLAPVTLQYERGTQRSHLATQAFKEFYLHNQPITESSKRELGNLYSDALIRYGQDMTSKLACKLSDQPVYAYEFEYQGRYSHGYIPGTNTPFGVVHHDDLIYLWFKTDYSLLSGLTSFTTGNPTPNASEVLNNVIWEQMTTDNLAYLSINSELKMKSGLYQDRMNIWDRYFPTSIMFSVYAEKRNLIESTKEFNWKNRRIGVMLRDADVVVYGIICGTQAP